MATRMPMRESVPGNFPVVSKAGIAVLRVDDRGVGASSGDRVPSTTYDEADDVRTEIAWLKSRPDIDAKRIALVGAGIGWLMLGKRAPRSQSVLRAASRMRSDEPSAVQSAKRSADRAATVGSPSLPISSRALRALWQQAARDRTVWAGRTCRHLAGRQDGGIPQDIRKCKLP